MTQPRIFVSHSHKDNDWCRPFVEALKRQGLDAWYDETGMQGSQAWVATLEKEVESRDIFLLVLTPDSWVAPWVQREFQLALATGRWILPVVLKETTATGFIRTIQWFMAIDMAPGAAASQVVSVLNSRESVPVMSSAPASKAPPLPGKSAPHIMPATLYDLGFVGREINGVEVIIPPVKNVPTGEFRMGSDKTKDPQAADDELPQHIVDLPAFQIGMFPVTVAEYACMVRANAAKEPQKVGEIDWAKQMTRQDHPVVCVSWQDAMAYAAWLAKMTGQGWHLPSEAEWEKAARGTDGRIYPWGNSWDKTRANTSESGHKMTTSVGSYPSGASPFGSQDMTGNVWEWTSTVYRPYPYRANDGREDRQDISSCVLRGGSWIYDPRNTRAACRNYALPDSWGASDGFRLVVRDDSDGLASKPAHVSAMTGAATIF